VQPGRGIGSLTLGQQAGDVIRVLGAPKLREDSAETSKGFAECGLRPDDHLLFFRGFDTAWEYDDRQPGYPAPAVKKDYPVACACFRKGKLVHIVLSSYVYESTRQIHVDGVRVFGPVGPLIDKLGDYHLVELGGSGPFTGCYDGEYMWPGLGISVVTQNDTVTVVDLFYPLSENETRAFFAQMERKKIADKRADTSK